MSLLKRVWIITFRNQKKTLLFLIAIFFLSVLMIGSLGISSIVDSLILKITHQNPPIFPVQFNNFAPNPARLDYLHVGPHPDWETINEISRLPEVKEYRLSMETFSFSPDLTWFSDFIDWEQVDWELHFNASSFLDSEEWKHSTTHIFFLDDAYQFPIWGSFEPIPIHFDLGWLTLLNGRFMTEEEIREGHPVALISEAVAQQNALEVGSTFVLENDIIDAVRLAEDRLQEDFEGWSRADYILDTWHQEVEVIGIFGIDIEINHNNAVNFGSSTYQLGQLYNRIYMPFDFAYQLLYTVELYWREAANLKLEDIFFWDAYFLLYDWRDYESFSQQANELLPDFWIIERVHPQFSFVTSWLDFIEQVAVWVLWGTMAASGVIMGMLIFSYILDRKYEICLYLSLGERRIRIVLQMLFEILFPGITAVLLAIIIGKGLLNSLSHLLFVNYLTSAVSQAPIGRYAMLELRSNLLTKELISFEMLEELFSVNIDFTTLMISFSWSFSVILISILLPLLFIFRIRPKKVLM